MSLCAAEGNCPKKAHAGVPTAAPAADAYLAAAHASSDCAGVLAGKPSFAGGPASVAGQSRAGRQVAEGRPLGICGGRALWARLAVSERWVNRSTIATGCAEAWSNALT